MVAPCDRGSHCSPLKYPGLQIDHCFRKNEESEDRPRGDDVDSSYNYVLDKDGKTPLQATMEQAALFLADVDARTVEKTKVSSEDSCDGEECKVSTVFLALDHGFGSGKPVLWETMIFGGFHDGYRAWYTSYEDAKIGHKRAVWIARGGLDQEELGAG